MTLPKSLPARPSLESLRKQAKQLARQLTVTNRDAQLALAREYGFASWRELREEVLKRTGKGLEWAVSEARRAIHDNDVQRLQALLMQHGELLTWRDEVGHPLLQATTPYAMDVSDPQREAQFCRSDCAAALIDAGALVTPPVWESLIRSGAAAMMALLQHKNVLPHTLHVLAALGEREGVRACLDGPQGKERDAVNYAFMAACRFRHEGVAAMLLDRAIAMDPGLGVQIDRWGDRAAFVADMIAHCPSLHRTTDPWPAFVIRQLLAAVDRDDLPAFAGWIADQPWLLDDQQLPLQAELVGLLAGANREAFIRAVLERSPALLRSHSPPPSQALIWALDAGHAHLVPLLTRIWPLPDDLAHAAGIGDLARVKRWFDDKGQPALGDPQRHHRNVRDGLPTAQQVLDAALAWAVMNRHFEVAEFLLAHGANVNTDWATHEPASILHECAMHGNYDGARFLIAHGIDLTIKDHRWSATAAGWALHAAHDQAMYELLTEAHTTRSSVSPSPTGSIAISTRGSR